MKQDGTLKMYMKSTVQPVRPEEAILAHDTYSRPIINSQYRVPVLPEGLDGVLRRVLSSFMSLML